MVLLAVTVRFIVSNLKLIVLFHCQLFTICLLINKTESKNKTNSLAFEIL